MPQPERPAVLYAEFEQCLTDIRRLRQDLTDTVNAIVGIEPPLTTVRRFVSTAELVDDGAGLLHYCYSKGICMDGGTGVSLTVKGCRFIGFVAVSDMEMADWVVTLFRHVTFASILMGR
jgi:hypothetical protein